MYHYYLYNSRGLAIRQGVSIAVSSFKAINIAWRDWGIDGMN